MERQVSEKVGLEQKLAESAIDCVLDRIEMHGPERQAAIGALMKQWVIYQHPATRTAIKELLMDTRLIKCGEMPGRFKPSGMIS